MQYGAGLISGRRSRAGDALKWAGGAAGGAQGQACQEQVPAQARCWARWDARRVCPGAGPWHARAVEHTQGEEPPEGQRRLTLELEEAKKGPFFRTTGTLEILHRASLLLFIGVA